MKKCTKCEQLKSEDQFHKKRSQCKACRKAYMDIYRRDNKVKILAKKKEWYNNLDQKERWERTKRCIERCPESFLADQMYHIKSRSNRPEHPPNPSCPKKRELDLDRPYLRDLWEKQEGKCALTKIYMIHKFGYLESVSIDRIDSTKGHTKKNVQLVCLAVNRMKNSYSNKEVLDFLSKIYAAKERTNVVKEYLDIIKICDCKDGWLPTKKPCSSCDRTNYCPCKRKCLNCNVQN